MNEIVKYLDLLERKALELHKGLPHLSPAVQKWLANNIWWLVAIGVILGILFLLSIILASLLAGVLVSLFSGGLGVAVAVVTLLVGLITSLGVALQVLVGALAIQPLKKHQKRGWQYLLLALAIDLAVTILSGVLTLNAFSIVWGVLWVAVSAYLLFEIRHFFVHGKVIEGEIVKIPTSPHS